jgi:hypothetical protein
MQETARRKKAEELFNDSYDHVSMLAERWAMWVLDVKPADFEPSLGNT